MATEKATDFIVRDLLKAAGIEATANVSNNPEIQKALKSASKRGTGKSVARNSWLFPGISCLWLKIRQIRVTKQNTSNGKTELPC